MRDKVTVRTRCSAQRIPFPRSSIDGAALLMCLVLLVPLLLLGASAMESAVLGEKMASNTEDRSRAFHAAEMAIVSGESWLRRQSLPPAATESGALGVWSVEGLSHIGAGVWWQHRDTDLEWWSENGIGVATGSELAQPAAFIIEQLAIHLHASQAESSLSASDHEVAESQRATVLYRLTALGVGRRASSRVRLQSTFLREFAPSVSQGDVEAADGNGAEIQGRLSWRQLD